MRRLAAPLSLLTLGSGLLVWLIAAPSAAAGDPCYHDYVLPTDTGASTTTVKLLPCAFSPTLTRVDVGRTVTFTNVTDFTHLVTGANQAWGSRDAEVGPGASVSYRFDTAGLYPYACALHRGMVGLVVVGDSAAAATVAGPAMPAAATADAAAGTGPLDVRLIVAGILAGTLLGGLVVWLVMRRGTARGPESASGIA